LSRNRRRNILLTGLGLAAVAAVLAFPRVLAFVELAAREIRYLWWLVLLVAVGIWLIFFYGKKGE
jgi:hypothetical protein